MAAHEALDAGDAFGAGGSRLLRGHHPEHAALEEFAATFFAAEKALYMSTGFIANYTLFTALPTRHDAIVFDERVHASARDGIQASPARRYKARHNDLDSFADAVGRARRRGARQIWITVESVYSMDGDLAPIGGLMALARAFDAMLIVDEAHATGVFGATGRGLCEGLEGDALITLHTCGKALGAAGALVCGPAVVIDYLINTARPVHLQHRAAAACRRGGQARAGADRRGAVAAEQAFRAHRLRPRPPWHRSGGPRGYRGERFPEARSCPSSSAAPIARWPRPPRCRPPASTSAQSARRPCPQAARVCASPSTPCTTKTTSPGLADCLGETIAAMATAPAA